MATPLLPNNPDNYMIPSNISVWFAPEGDDGTLGDYFDLGNVADLTLQLNDTYLDHMSARNGLMSPDQRVITQVEGNINFTLDEPVQKNLELIFRPDETPDASATYTVQEQKRIRLSGTTAVTIDRRAVENTSIDYLELGNIVVKSADGSTTYTDSTDYTFTQATGSGSSRTPATIARTTSGSITDGVEVVVLYTYSRNVTSYKIQSGAILNGAMKIQALNLIGPMFAYYFPRVSISIEGDQAINPSEWFKQGFSCRILTDGTGSRGEFYLFDKFQKLVVAA